MKKSIDVDMDALNEQHEGRAAIVEESAGVVEGDVIDEDGDPRDKLPAHAVENADGSVTLPLFQTVEIATRKDGKVRTQEHKDLTFHRLNGADMRAIASTSEDMQSVMTFARSTRIPVMVMTAIFDKLDMADIADGGRIMNHFLTHGRKMPR